MRLGRPLAIESTTTDDATSLQCPADVTTGELCDSLGRQETQMVRSSGRTLATRSAAI
jgi:hypothetical protein